MEKGTLTMTLILEEEEEAEKEEIPTEKSGAQGKLEGKRRD